MPKETVDGATREVEIDRKDEVAKRLMAGAAKGGEDAPAEEPPPSGPAAGEEGGEIPPAEQQPDDDDLVTYDGPDGQKRQIRLAEVAKNPDAKRALAEQLSRGLAPHPSAEDREQEIERAARRLAVDRDIKRGLIRYNELTGQLEETELAVTMRTGQAGRGGRREIPEDADSLEYLSDEERSQYDALVEKGIGEGDKKALLDANKLQRAADSRARRADRERMEARFQADLVKRDQVREAQDAPPENRRLVDAEIAKFPAVFGKFDPATGRFENEVRAQIVRNQVATGLRLTKSLKVDHRHIGMVARAVEAFGVAAPAAPTKDNHQQTQRRESAPPSVGPGSKVPPGPPPRKDGGGAGQGSGGDKPKRPGIGTQAMVDQVAKRLRELSTT